MLIINFRLTGVLNDINLDLRLYLTKISYSVAILKIRLIKSVIHCTHIYKYNGYGDCAFALCIFWSISIHITQISQKTPVVPQDRALCVRLNANKRGQSCCWYYILIAHFVDFSSFFTTYCIEKKKLLTSDQKVLFTRGFNSLCPRILD